MDYKEFKQSLRQKVMEQADPGAEVTLQAIPKNNGVRMDAITVRMPGEKIAPAIYLAQYYLEYSSGVPVEDLAGMVLKKNTELMKQRGASVKLMRRFEDIRDHIRYRLVNFRMNTEMLKYVPFARVLDLACIFYYNLLCPNRETGSVIIKKRDLDEWQISEEELRKTAERNMERFVRAEVIPMKEALGMEEESEAAEGDMDIPMYILTNRERLYGASCLLYPDILLPLAEQLHSDLFILPSSIHEVILVPDKGCISRAELEQSVREINQTEVAPYEVLSDHVYYYDRRERRVLM